MKLYVAGEEVADGEGWEEGECVGGLDVSAGVGGEILTLDIHTKSVGYMYIHVVRYNYNYRIAKTILRRTLFFFGGGGGGGGGGLKIKTKN